MSKSKTSSRPGRKSRRDRYKNEDRKEKNRLLKLERHLKKFPNDAQAKEAQSRAKPYKAASKNSIYPVTQIHEVIVNRKPQTIVTRMSRAMVQMKSKIRKAMNAFAYDKNRLKREEQAAQKAQKKKYGLADLFN